MAEPQWSCDETFITQQTAHNTKVTKSVLCKVCRAKKAAEHARRPGINGRSDAGRRPLLLRRANRFSRIPGGEQVLTKYRS
uniref:Uncharacterized protein n=1 Tax=Trichuris muris TaxID=70415 RepID=A0A5S6QCT7_TRIMR